MNSRNLIVQTLKVTQTDDVNIYEDHVRDSIHTMAPFTIEGGMSVGKGIKIGVQENLVPGLIVYDGENFMGFSEKFGLTMLGVHQQSTFLELPNSLLLNNRIQPTPKPLSNNGENTINNNSMGNSNNGGLKRLNIELEIKDISNFYVKIPQSLGNDLHFDVEFVFVENCFISEFHLFVINESLRDVRVNLGNKMNVQMRIKKEKNMNNEVKGGESVEWIMRRISNQYLFISKKEYE